MVNDANHASVSNKLHAQHATAVQACKMYSALETSEEIPAYGVRERQPQARVLSFKAERSVLRGRCLARQVSVVGMQGKYLQTNG